MNHIQFIAAPNTVAGKVQANSMPLKKRYYAFQDNVNSEFLHLAKRNEGRSSGVRPLGGTRIFILESI